MPHPSLHCPNCLRRLASSESPIHCQCGEVYEVRDGIPQLVLKRFFDDFKRNEQHFHDELSASLRVRPIKGRDADFHLHFKRPLIELPQGSTVLELACGTRADGIEIALAEKEVTSLDISFDAVRRAHELAYRNGVSNHMRFVVADAEHLPFGHGAFNASFVAASFHHFPNQFAALKEMKRVTKPGGYVIWGVEPAAWPYRTIFRLLSPVKRFIRQRRKRQFNSIADDTTEGYTRSQIHELFTSAQLTIVDIKPVKFLTEFYDSAVMLIAKLLHKDVQPLPSLDHVLSRIDSALERVPGLKKLFWHWNVIAKVPHP